MTSSKKHPLEITIQVKRTDCLISDATFNLANIKGLSRLKIEAEETLHSVEVEKIDDKTLATLRKVSRKMVQAGTTRLWVYGKSCSACKFMALSDAVVLGTKSIDRNTVRFRLLISSNGNAKKIVHELEESGLEPIIIDGPNEIKTEITDRENQILRLCLDLGYFDNEREASLKDISKLLGISVSSLSETLRRGLRKITEDYVNRNPV
ncbi:MAG: helix-turn-helix domain-containing protein [Thermoplasmataceae archaeon]